MLSKLSNLRVVDSSGAGWVQLFHLYGGFYRRSAEAGGFVKAAVKKIAFYPRPRRGKRYKPLRVGRIVRGMVVHTRFYRPFHDGVQCRFLANTTVLLKKRGMFRSKYFSAPLARLIRRRKYQALFSSFVLPCAEPQAAVLPCLGLPRLASILRAPGAQPCSHPPGTCPAAPIHATAMRGRPAPS